MDQYLVKAVLALRSILDDPPNSEARVIAAQAYFYATDKGIVTNIDNYLKKEKNK